MSAFDVTAASVTNDFGSVTGVTVSIPVDAIVWADKTPRMASGGSVRAPVNAITWSSKTPRMSAGQRINIPVNAITWSDKTLRKSSGKSVFIPRDVAILMATMGARISSGGSARIPKDNFALSTVVSMRSGGSVFAPVSNITMTNKTPRVTTGTNIWIPTDTVVVWADKSVRVTTGAYIGINTDHIMQLNVGSTTEDVTAGHVTLEGDPFTNIFKLPDRLVTTNLPVSMRSGGSARIPRDTLAITEQRVEIGARRRRLRTSAIAS